MKCTKKCIHFIEGQNIEGERCNWVECGGLPAFRNKQSDSDKSTMNFSSSGLGIGGAGNHDLHRETLELIASGEMVIVEHHCGWGGTRYDERCAGCGRITAICNDCELCRRCHG